MKFFALCLFSLSCLLFEVVSAAAAAPAAAAALNGPFVRLSVEAAGETISTRRDCSFSHVENFDTCRQQQQQKQQQPVSQPDRDIISSDPHWNHRVELNIGNPPKSVYADIVNLRIASTTETEGTGNSGKHVNVASSSRVKKNLLRISIPAEINSFGLHLCPADPGMDFNFHDELGRKVGNFDFKMLRRFVNEKHRGKIPSGTSSSSSGSSGSSGTPEKPYFAYVSFEMNGIRDIYVAEAGNLRLDSFIYQICQLSSLAADDYQNPAAVGHSRLRRSTDCPHLIDGADGEGGGEGKGNHSVHHPFGHPGNHPVEHPGNHSTEEPVNPPEATWEEAEEETKNDKEAKVAKTAATTAAAIKTSKSEIKGSSESSNRGSESSKSSKSDSRIGSSSRTASSRNKKKSSSSSRSSGNNEMPKRNQKQQQQQQQEQQPKQSVHHPFGHPGNHPIEHPGNPSTEEPVNPPEATREEAEEETKNDNEAKAAKTAAAITAADKQKRNQRQQREQQQRQQPRRQQKKEKQQ